MGQALKPCPTEEAERHVRQMDDDVIVVNAGAAGLDNNRATFLLRALKKRPDVATVNMSAGNRLTVVPHDGLVKSPTELVQLVIELVRQCILELKRQLGFAHRAQLRT